MAIAKITKRFVDTLRAGDKTYAVYDTELKGFGVRVMAKRIGRAMVASYFVEYRPDGGGRKVAKKRDTFARVNELTPDQARKLASDKLSDVRRGKDPVLDKRTRRQGLRVFELIDQWEEENPAGRRSRRPMLPRTKAYTLARLRHHVVPTLGNKRIADLTTADVNGLIMKVKDGGTIAGRRPSGKKRGSVLVRGGEGAARKVTSDLSLVLSYAVEKGIIAANPASGARKPREGKRHSFLDFEQLKKLNAAIDGLEKKGANISGLNILRLILLTGARPGEVEGLKWIEIDFQGRALRLRSSKTGYSMRPLSQPALDILQNTPRVEGTDYVFPAARGKGHFTSSKKLWQKARKIAELPSVVRYEARHTVATVALSEGHDPAAVAALMGHSGPKTTLAIYAHLFGSSAVRAADSVGAKIAAAMAAKPTDADGE